jgi:hypothetical protein
MTLDKFLTLLERITLLKTKREVDLFVQNELTPLAPTEGRDHRFRDLSYSASTRRNYLRK